MEKGTGRAIQPYNLTLTLTLTLILTLALTISRHPVPRILIIQALSYLNSCTTISPAFKSLKKKRKKERRNPYPCLIEEEKKKSKATVNFIYLPSFLNKACSMTIFLWSGSCLLASSRDDKEPNTAIEPVSSSFRSLDANSVKSSPFVLRTAVR